MWQRLKQNYDVLTPEKGGSGRASIHGNREILIYKTTSKTLLIYYYRLLRVRQKRGSSLGIGKVRVVVFYRSFWGIVCRTSAVDGLARAFWGRKSGHRLSRKPQENLLRGQGNGFSLGT